MTKGIELVEPFGVTEQQKELISKKTEAFVSKLTVETIRDGAMDYLREEVFHCYGMQQLIGWMLEKHLKESVPGYEDLVGKDGEGLERILESIL